MIKRNQNTITTGSKTIDKFIANHPMGHAFESGHKEYEECGDFELPSWWVHLKEGYKFTAMGCGTVHEDTIKEVIKEMKRGITKV